MKTRHSKVDPSAQSSQHAAETVPSKKCRRKRLGFFRFFRSLLFLLLIAAIALIVLSFTGVLGNGIQAKAEATFQALVYPTSATNADKSLPVVSQSPDAADTTLLTVSESGITYAGNAVTQEGLRDALLASYQQGTTITLQDQQAIKADYDAVKAVLTELGIPFIEQ